MISGYMDLLDEMKAHYNKRLGEYNILLSNVNNLVAEIKANQDIQDKNLRISQLLQKAAEVSRGNIKTHLENVCTMALKYVFDKDLEFVIEIEECRGRPEAEFYIQYTNGKETIKVKPDDASGGGVVDVISIALRFAFLELMSEPKIQGPILLDEPAKMVSEVAATRMAALLKDLKDSFDRQTIMSTHNDLYGSMANKEFQVIQAGAKSKVFESTPITQANISVGNIDLGDDDNA